MTSELENIVYPMRGKLVIGEHDSIILLGAKCQNEIKECSKSLSKILLESTIDLDITIADVVRKIECFCGRGAYDAHFGEFRLYRRKDPVGMTRVYEIRVDLIGYHVNPMPDANVSH